MTKNPARRLGCSGNESQIRNHSFFKDLDWTALEERRVKPPFRPRVVCASFLSSCFQCFSKVPTLNTHFDFEYLQKSPKDALNFDVEFTKEEPVLTLVPNDVVRTINQEEFAGFTFVNPNFGPERKVC